MTGAFLAYYLSLRNTRKRHYSDDVLNDYFVYALWIGVLGARLWYCLFYNLAYYIANPIKFLAINEGGLAIHGGVIAVLIYSYFYCHKKNIDILEIHNIVESALDNVNPKVAQSYRNYRNYNTTLPSVKNIPIIKSDMSNMTKATPMWLLLT